MFLVFDNLKEKERHEGRKEGREKRREGRDKVRRKETNDNKDNKMNKDA